MGKPELSVVEGPVPRNTTRQSREFEFPLIARCEHCHKDIDFQRDLTRWRFDPNGNQPFHHDPRKDHMNCYNLAHPVPPPTASRRRRATGILTPNPVGKEVVK